MGVDMDCSLSMFLHEFYQHRDPGFFTEPPSPQLSDINRAALAGIAEWLCHRYHYPVPSWTELPEYFLPQERNWFEDMFDQEFLETQREFHVGRSAPGLHHGYRDTLIPVDQASRAQCRQATYNVGLEVRFCTFLVTSISAGMVKTGEHALVRSR